MCNCKLRNSGTVYANTFKFKPFYSIYRHKYNSIPYLIHTLNNAIPTIAVNNAKLYWTLQRPRGSQEVEVDSNRTLWTPSQQATVPSQLHIYPTTISIIRNFLALMQLAKMLSTTDYLVSINTAFFLAHQQQKPVRPLTDLVLFLTDPTLFLGSI